MSPAAFENHTPTEPSADSVRDRFVKQSEDWIRRVAEELPEDVLVAAMANLKGPGGLTPPMEIAGDLDALHGALLMRTMGAVERIVRDMPGDLLITALAAPSDFGALARTLGDPRVADPSSRIDPLAGAIGRSISHRQQLEERAGEMLTSAQVSELLGIKRQAIDKRRNGAKMLGIRRGSDWLYPAFQFGSYDVLDSIEAVLSAHPGVDPWVIVDILLAPDDALGGRRLLDAVQAGDDEAVQRHVSQTQGDGFA